MQLQDIFDTESKEKAIHIYALVALKMTKKIYHQLPKNIQQIVDDAEAFWHHDEDRLVTKKQMETHASVISKLRWDSPNRYEMNDNMELKVLQLCMIATVDTSEFDYHLDWMYEVGRKIGFSSQKLDQLIEESIEEYKSNKYE